MKSADMIHDIDKAARARRVLWRLWFRALGLNAGVATQAAPAQAAQIDDEDSNEDGDGDEDEGMEEDGGGPSAAYGQEDATEPDEGVEIEEADEGRSGVDSEEDEADQVGEDRYVRVWRDAVDYGYELGWKAAMRSLGQNAEE